MQHPANYQTVLVTKTVFKRLVNHHAVCSGCGHCVNTHGGSMPCHGANAIINMEIMAEVISHATKKTPESDGRPIGPAGFAGTIDSGGYDAAHHPGSIFGTRAEEDGFRLWE